MELTISNSEFSFKAVFAKDVELTGRLWKITEGVLSFAEEDFKTKLTIRKNDTFLVDSSLGVKFTALQDCETEDEPPALAEYLCAYVQALFLGLVPLKGEHFEVSELSTQQRREIEPDLLDKKSLLSMLAANKPTFN